MCNIEGVELTEAEINNVKLIAKDLIYYSYGFAFFCREYADKLHTEDAQRIWNEAYALIAEL